MIKWRWSALRGLRFRLIGWYVLLLVLTLVVFSVYIFFQFRNLQQQQQDSALNGTADQLRGAVDTGPPGSQQTPVFRRNFGPQPISLDLTRRNIQVRLFNSAGQQLDTLGNSVADMPQPTTPLQPGMSTISSTDGEQWRIVMEPLQFQAGWLEVGQTITVVNAEFSSLFTPILVGALLALVFAVLGGLFLASRALSPIERVTRTAQVINARDLSKRIRYDGPPDEIGRLAATLDQMFDRLEQGFEQERRFTSDASHELRTPLTALKGRIEVSLSRERDLAQYQTTLTDLNHEVDRLIRLSNSLLYLARLDQAGPSWEAEQLNLSDMLDSIVDSMEAVAELKDVQLLANITPDVHLEGNLDLLTRLFLNLVDNAIKYTPAGGRVTLRLETAAKVARVLVTDTGPGIALEHLPHLFKRFYRVQSDRASTSGGAGLGLAIAHEIARQHGGTLEVQSELGHGTTMRVELPLD